MSKAVNRVSSCFIVLALVVSAGCGGGGGGGDGDSGPRLNVSTSEMFFGAPATGPQPAGQSVTGTVSNYSGTLYLYIVHTANGISNISMPTFQGTSGTSTVTVKSPNSLGQGAYFDTITVLACSDSACTSHVPGSPVAIPVTYVVGIAAVPSSLVFGSAAGVAPQSQTVRIYHYGQNTNWASSYLSGTDWMTYDPGSGVTPTTVKVDIAAMPAGTAGTFNSFIRFGANAGNDLVDVPITYTVH